MRPVPSVDGRPMTVRGAILLVAGLALAGAPPATTACNSVTDAETQTAATAAPGNASARSHSSASAALRSTPPGSSGTTRAPSVLTTSGRATHSAHRRHKSARVRGQMAPTAERIGEIQTALSKSGTYQGEPSGKWDDATVSAMKRFQQSRGLSPTGKLDALTLQRLGLGSEIAGRAAPRPGAPPSSDSIRN
jgi:murein L,D-transpeptidase YcbB/YkuD